MFTQDDLTVSSDDKDAPPTISATVTAHYAPTSGEHFEFVLLARDGETDEKFAYAKVSLSEDVSEGKGDFKGDPSLAMDGTVGALGGLLGGKAQQYGFFARLSWVLFVGFVIVTGLLVVVKYGKSFFSAGGSGLGTLGLGGRSHRTYQRGQTSFEMHPAAGSGLEAAQHGGGYYEPPNAIGYNRIE